MERQRKAIILLAAVGFAALTGNLIPQDITITGSWSLVIDASDLQSGPGSDLEPQYASADDQIIVDIIHTNRRWSVTVHGVVNHWHNDLSVYLRRRSDGSGPGWISGGTCWQKVSLTPQYFFQGNKRRTDIDVQCGLDGVSIQVPPDTYSGSIIYTVVEN